MELEIRLRKSPMDYSLKANFYLYGCAFTPCKDCPFKGERPAIPIWKKTEKCFQRCKFQIIIWILSKEQLEIYEKVRPPEMKKKDIELAINQGRLAQIEATLRESKELTVSPSF